MSKKKICFFSGDITRTGGTERVAIMIANELNKDDTYEISFVSLVEKKNKTFFPIDEGIPRWTLYDKLVSGTTHFFGYVHRIRKILKEKDIDILIDIDGIIDVYSVLAKRNTKAKVVSWEHFNMYHHPSQKLRSRVRNFSVKRVDAIVTLTEQDKGYYEETYNPNCPVVAICNPVSYTGIDNTYDEESKKIISIGRLTHQKGFDRLVDIADDVLKKHSDWEWYVYGEGEDKETLLQSIKEKGISNLHLMGNADDIDYKYKESAMFVMTSRYEGLPMTLLEAKYYKLPIVSYDIKTGPRECIIDGVNGYLVEDGNQEQIVDRINELIEDEEKRKEFSNHALDETDKFDLSHIISQWKELFEELGRA